MFVSIVVVLCEDWLNKQIHHHHHHSCVCYRGSYCLGKCALAVYPPVKGPGFCRIESQAVREERWGTATPKGFAKLCESPEASWKADRVTFAFALKHQEERTLGCKFNRILLWSSPNLISLEITGVNLLLAWQRNVYVDARYVISIQIYWRLCDKARNSLVKTPSLVQLSF